MEPFPRIAVVIPTRNRETRVAFALEALAAQTLPRDQFEVLVVRDASQQGPFTPPPDGLHVRYLTHPGSSGPATKRNLGWRATDAALVAFTDDDCRPAPDWLEQLLAADQEGHFLQGRTAVDPDEAHLLRGLARTRVVVGPSDWYPGCNMAYARSLLVRLGGFDESFHFGGEDTDLALRAKAIGASPRYVDAAVVWHAVLSRTLLRAIRDAFAWPTFALVLSRHPEQRSRLYLSLFRNKAHATLILATVGALLLHRRPALGLVALAPYVEYKVADGLAHTAPSPRALASILLRLPAPMLVETIEIVATVRSAIRYRTVVL